MNAVNEYFSGERLQCLIGIGISAVSIALSLYFLLQVKTALFKGIAWPFLIISVLLLSVCIGVVWRTPQDIARVTRYVTQEKEKVVSEEIPRMEKVMRSFRVIKAVELVLLAIGLFLVLYGSMKGNKLLMGIGVGLAIQSAIMYGFDHFAQNRGREYVEFLQNF